MGELAANSSRADQTSARVIFGRRSVTDNVIVTVNDHGLYITISRTCQGVKIRF